MLTEQRTVIQMTNDLISRQQAIAEFSCCELTPDGGIDANHAIDVLKQLPSAQPETHDKHTETHACDLISRQAVIEALCSECQGRCIPCDSYPCSEVAAIKAVPSTQPERKKGRWINRSLNVLYPEWERYTCSVCGKHSDSYDYCPNCGADMRQKEGSDDNRLNNT